jgi:hypothetical protein
MDHAEASEWVQLTENINALMDVTYFSKGIYHQPNHLSKLVIRVLEECNAFITQKKEAVWSSNSGNHLTDHIVFTLNFHM